MGRNRRLVGGKAEDSFKDVSSCTALVNNVSGEIPIAGVIEVELGALGTCDTGEVEFSGIGISPVIASEFICEGDVDVELFEVDYIVEVDMVAAGVIIVGDHLGGFDVLNAIDFTVV